MKRNFLILSAVLIALFTFSASFAQTPPPKQEGQNDLGYEVGSLVEAADYRGAWYRSKITEVDNGKYHVHFFGWDAAWDEWVTSDKLRYSDDPDFGREIEAEQNGVWYKALIIDSRYGTEHLVAYVDYNEDEWVKDERIRETGDGWHYQHGGVMVEVAYGKSWRRAHILKRRAGEIYVHYEGETDVWNEWVSESKVRRVR